MVPLVNFLTNFLRFHSTNKPLIVLLTTSALWLTAIWPGVSAQAANATPFNVVIVNSWDKNLPWSVLFEKGLRAGLKDNKNNFQLYFEYLDSGRFPNKSQQQVMFDYLQNKYRDSKINAIVAEGIPAFQFLSTQTDLLPDARRIYITSGGPGNQQNIHSDVANKKGINIQIHADFEDSIKEMLRRVSPQTLYVISDTLSPGGNMRLAGFKTALAKVAPTLETEYLVNMRMNDLLATVSHLPPGSAIYYLLVFQDGNGQKIDSFLATRLILGQANAPAFSNWSVLVGYGVMGGYMISSERVGHTTAHVIQNLQQGVKPTIHDAAGNTYGYYYDWRLLKRWNIDKDQLPTNTELMFYQPMLFEKYTREIIATVTFLLLLTLLSISLLIINKQRRKAIVELNEERNMLEKRIEARTVELQISNRELAKLSITDPLTLIANRRHFDSVLRDEVDRLRRTRAPLSLIMIDVDHFKSFNDNHGHITGDECLRRVGALLQHFVHRPPDLAARFGGEEFAIILPETDAHGAQAFAERLRQEIAGLDIPLGKPDQTLHITASIGVATVFVTRTITADDIIQLADSQLYQAKASGRNRVVSFHRAA
jgi:two-component system cell cycle response regulator